MKTVALGDVLEIISGFAFKSSHFNEAGNGLPLIRCRDVNTGFSGTYYDGPYDDQFLVNNGDLLVSMDGDFRTIRWANGTALLNQRVCKLEPYRNRLHPAYLLFFLPKELEKIHGKTAFATVKHLSARSIQEIEIPLLPLDEQKWIAAILDKADAIRRKRAAALRLADDFLQSAFLDMFGDPVANPNGWPTINFESAAPAKGQIVDGPFGSSLKPESYVDSGIRVIRNFNIGDDNFDESDYKFVTPEKFQEIKRSEVVPGDLLISTKGTIGNVCQMPELPGKSVLSASGTVRIRLGKKTEIRPLFVVVQMITPQFKRYLKQFQAGTNQKYLNLSAIRKIQLVVPPLDLQDRFLTIRQKVRQSKKRGDQAFRESESFFNSLARRAFRGEPSLCPSPPSP